jgi:3D (Asp-Asp-Asp) domain-containing protein
VSLRNPRPALELCSCFLAVLVSGCAWLRPAPPPPPARPATPAPEVRELEVTATAYNSTQGQTDSSPGTTAFGDRLEPGMRIVAVSRDLEALGLTEGVTIRIEGLDGEWRVGDRMHGRWKRKIDIYFGDDVEAAKRWGKRRVLIRW